MTKRGKKTAPKKRASAHPPHAELRAASPEAAQPMGPLLPEKKRPFWERARSELRPIVFSLAVAGLLIVAKRLVEPTVFGQQLDQMGARLLQVQLMQLSDFRGRRDNPVRIVNISSLSPSSSASAPATEAIVVTDRCKLWDILDQVAHADPMAIGIDIDFDPEPDGTASDEDYNFLDHCRNPPGPSGRHGPASDEDSSFLDYCLKLQGPSGRRIPVFVGIYKSLALGRERWLGDPRFAKMGTSIIVPFKDKDHKSAPTGRMIRQISLKVNNQTVKADSLSYSLFKIARSEATNLRMKRTQLGKVEVEANTFPINFGLLQKLMSRTDFCIKAEDIGSHLSDLSNNIVLIGRATPGEAPDAFTTTASDEPIPGIYIHAAAVYTLMEAPLWELSGWVRYSIDLLLALVIIVFDRLLEHLLGSVTHDKLRTRLEAVVPALLAVVVLTLGVLFVVFTRIYWTDFVAVAIAQLIHKPLEAFCHIVWEVVQKSPRLLWRKT